MLKERKWRKESVLEELIAEIFLPMTDIIVRKDRVGRVSIFKEGIKFGMVENDALYLFDQGGEYQKVGRDLLSDSKKLLQGATKSFLHACSNIDFSKHS